MFEALNKHLDHLWRVRVFGHFYRLFVLKNAYGMHRRVIVGAADTWQKGFLSTDIDVLDITKSFDWAKLFAPESLEAIVMEHVLEHLDKKQGSKALELCFAFLKKGGRIRIAVPDKNRRDPLYIKEVAPPADGHKSYYNARDLTDMLKKCGFEVRLLEWHDANDVFHHKAFSDRYGLIKRSFGNDHQKRFARDDYFYTSLIVDAIKPVE